MSDSVPHLTKRAQDLLELARQIAARQGRDEVDAEHLLLGMASQNDGAVSEVLRALGIDDARQIEAMLLAAGGAAGAGRDLPKRVDKYIHDTAHDFKSKISAVRGYAELLTKMMEMLSKQAQSLDGIVKSADALLDMVNVEANSWLPLAEASTGARPLPCDLGKVAGQAVSVLDRAENTPDVGVLFDVPAGDWWVWGYESLLHGAILNLAQEAVRRSAAGQQVNITLGDNEGDVWLRIRDQGPSLLEPAVGRVAVIRLDESGAIKGQPAAAMIITAHGGKLEARDLPEGGAEFVVLFPREIVIAAGE